MDDGEVEAGQMHLALEDVDFHSLPARDVEPQ